MTHDTIAGRWGGHPTLARIVRVLIFLAPVAASVGAAALVSTVLPATSGLWDRFAALAVLVLVSTLVLVAVDRLARRALPLATLLDLSLLFPDSAPSRLAVAREAIRRVPIEEQLARVAGAGADPGAVAREILTLVAALSAHDRPTRGHAERVRMFTDLLAEELRVPQRHRDLLRWAAILHDVGKLRVPTALLNKPGKPTSAEWVVLRAHPADGAEIAGALLPWLGEWGAVIAEHHERYDGTGYPLGLGGTGISLGARIVSVADAYDVMTAARAYQRPVSRAAARRELVRFSGTQFDPVVVRAMLSVSTPRLRRAQGLLAWLADIPLVASGSVPAATVARVVGAGALATGAVAGGAGIGAVAAEPTPRAHAQALTTQQAPARTRTAPEPTATALAAPAHVAATRPSRQPHDHLAPRHETTPAGAKDKKSRGSSAAATSGRPAAADHRNGTPGSPSSGSKQKSSRSGGDKAAAAPTSHPTADVVEQALPEPTTDVVPEPVGSAPSTAGSGHGGSSSGRGSGGSDDKAGGGSGSGPGSTGRGGGTSGH